MEDQTVYKIETTDKDEMILMLNATRMAQALYDLIDWKRAVYNAKDYDTSILFKGKIYDQNEWYRDSDKIITKDDKDENGYLIGYEEIYTMNTLERKLEELLTDVEDFIYNYFK